MNSVVYFKNSISNNNFIENIESIKNNSNIKCFGYYFKNGDASIGTSNYFYIKLKKENDYNLLVNFSKDKKVKIISNVSSMPLWYIMSVENTNFTSIELSNQFYESGLFANVDPAFCFNFKPNCSDDTNFNEQWGLQKTIKKENYGINICDAWNISKGENTIIAVIDQGIDINHKDLKDNIHYNSFNSILGQSPSEYIQENNHGTHVAGIIGAIQNNKFQITGVAPNSKLMCISNPLMGSPTISAELANGISWAWKNGADVINNSWGDQGGNLYNILKSSILDEAISNALTKGRNGKGCVVVFASGNYSPKIDYPANSNDDILVVGSIKKNGYRNYSSGYGSKLDIVAPGRDILSTINENQTQYLSGTSMAAPHVSGIAALILSINPNFTGREVNNIIESTTQKINI